LFVLGCPQAECPGVPFGVAEVEKAEVGRLRGGRGEWVTRISGPGLFPRKATAETDAMGFGLEGQAVLAAPSP
jgi:hypothetical protein